MSDYIENPEVEGTKEKRAGWQKKAVLGTGVAAFAAIAAAGSGAFWTEQAEFEGYFNSAQLVDGGLGVQVSDDGGATWQDARDGALTVSLNGGYDFVVPNSEASEDFQIRLNPEADIPVRLTNISTSTDMSDGDGNGVITDETGTAYVVDIDGTLNGAAYSNTVEVDGSGAEASANSVVGDDLVFSPSNVSELTLSVAYEEALPLGYDFDTSTTFQFEAVLDSSAW